MEWHRHLCEYYNVDPAAALELGTRASGRKPSLPGSPTCHPVTGMTYEDIWDLSDRNTTEGVFQFYKDQGAWSTFRQCVRHKDFVEFHKSLLMPLVKKGSHICEYGSGVAPFVTTFLNNVSKEDAAGMQISISDLPSEHFEFAKWRLQRIIEEKGFKTTLNPQEITPTSLPKYGKGLDLVLLFEVMEHVPSPVQTIINLINQMLPNSLLIENFIKHQGALDDDGPDLKSAALEREKYYDIISSCFKILYGSEPSDGPNDTRVWTKVV